MLSVVLTEQTLICINKIKWKFWYFVQKSRFFYFSGWNKFMCPRFVLFISTLDLFRLLPAPTPKYTNKRLGSRAKEFSKLNISCEFHTIEPSEKMRNWDAERHKLVWTGRSTIILLHMAFPFPFDIGFRLERGDGRRKGCRVDKREGRRPRGGRGGGGAIGCCGSLGYI